MRYALAGCAVVALIAPAAFAINGNQLALRSTGSASGGGGDWTLSQNGYLGAYVTLTQPGSVSFAIDASGTPGNAVNPNLNLVVGDSKTSFSVAPGFNTYNATLALPAGTHFVRAELTNDTPTIDRPLTLRSLTVSGGGASLVNSNTSSLALAAADTYIQTGRKGDATLALLGAAPGSAVSVKLVNHAFNFGGNVPGSSLSNVSAYLNNPAFTDFFTSHFNTVVVSNAGKWGNNEAVRDVNVMTGPDAMLDFAEAHNLRARQHNLIWGNQQPAWMNILLASSANNQQVRDEISERIDYYVGDGDADTTDGDRARRYIELDVYNETWHTGSNNGTSRDYWSRLGVSGVSDIYKEVAQAVQAAGSDAKLYVNEYNILQDGIDAYGNWYRQQIEAIQNADGNFDDGPVSGIGMQLYAVNGHSAAYMQQVLQNLSVTGLPLTLTEFGVQDSVTDEAAMLKMVEDSIRMIFGSPNATTFMYWGFLASATSNLQSASILLDANGNLTAAGKLYEDLLGIHDWDGDPTNGWTTDLDLVVGPGGTIDFTGFYGDYAITINGQTYDLSLIKGQSNYLLTVPEPGSATALAAMGACLMLRPRSVSKARKPGGGDVRCNVDLLRRFSGL